MAKVIEQWDDYGDHYATVSITEDESVCVKRPFDGDGYIYVMQCENGYEVYKNSLGPDTGFRHPTEKEYDEILEITEEIFSNIDIKGDME